MTKSAVMGTSGETPLPARAPRTMKTITSIQYLRALACIAVVVFHATEDLGGAFNIGQTGVDLFFVISGFIMWSITEHREPAPGNFLLRRIVRIVPLYWLITLAIFAKCAMLPGDGSATSFTYSNLIHSLFFIPYLSSDGNILPVLYPGWTINYEMFFYLVMAGVLFLRRSWQFPILCAIFVGLVAAGVVLDPETAIGRTYTSGIIFEFLFGAALARLWLSGWTIGARAGGLMVVLGLAILGVGHALLPLPHYQAWRFLEAGVPAALILCGAISCEAVLPRLEALKSIGDGSYAIYLVHASVLNLTSHLHFARPIVVLLAVALSIAVGMALHVAETWVRSHVRTHKARNALGTSSLLPAQAG